MVAVMVTLSDKQRPKLKAIRSRDIQVLPQLWYGVSIV